MFGAREHRVLGTVSVLPQHLTGSWGFADSVTYLPKLFRDNLGSAVLCNFSTSPMAENAVVLQSWWLGFFCLDEDI